MDLIQLLDSHGTYLSPVDEGEIMRRSALDGDVADWAIRTCLCGVRLDGFDAYHLHLRRILSDVRFTPNIEEGEPGD